MAETTQSIESLESLALQAHERAKVATNLKDELTNLENEKKLLTELINRLESTETKKTPLPN